jgi:hypothetical protein
MLPKTLRLHTGARKDLARTTQRVESRVYLLSVIVGAAVIPDYIGGKRQELGKGGKSLARLFSEQKVFL